MLAVGCHLSASKGYAHMAKEATEIGASVFQFFTRNPRGGQARKPDGADIAAFLALARDNQLGPFMAHAPYTLNPCARDPRVRDFARQVLTDDLRLLARLPNTFYNMHPGNHVGQGTDAGIALTADLLNATLEPAQPTIVLLETMSGRGTELGVRFEELRAIIDRVEQHEKIGVCLDTCHIHAAGYDLVQDWEGVLEAFDRQIGLDRLRAIHLNDSQNPLGSRKDRHEKIGEGTIGLQALAQVITHDRTQHVPVYLETPNDLAGYAKEIHLLKQIRAQAGKGALPS